jgi:uncharacterized SAM-dependent methyltransferase
LGLKNKGSILIIYLFHSQRAQDLAFQAAKEIQNGVLKVNGLIAFHYFYDELGCKKMQTVKDGL